jgi:hypothetical protein
MVRLDYCRNWRINSSTAKPSSMKIQEIIEASREIGLFLYGIFFIYLIIHLIRRRREEFWSAIKGDDNKLQLTEIFGLVFLVLSIFIVIAESSFHAEISPSLWAFLDGAILIVFGAHSYIKKQK